VRWVSSAVFYALPNLENFNWKGEAVYGSLHASVIPYAAGYLFSYGGAVLLLACLLFARKDFK
jgi:hypothetical protein